MPSTYTSNNKIQKIATGEQSGSWGNTTNTNFDLFDTAIDGFVSVTLSGTTHTLNIPDGSAGDGRNKVLVFTGTLAATNTISVTPNTVKKHYYVQNNTTGSQNIVISQGSGSSVTVKPGYSSIVYLDGAGSSAAVKEVLTSLKLTALIEATGAVLNGSSSGSTTLQASATASGTITLPAATDTLVGKATTDTFTNKTFDTAGTGNVLRINGTQVSAVTGSGSVVLATSPTLVTPLLGTPTSGTLTNCTGLPISSGVSGLGSGVATFLATPSSANLASAVTDETGTGALVFGTSPTIATPTITTSATVPLIIGGTGTTSTLTLRSTSGVGTTGADIIFQSGNNGATEVMRLQNGGNVGIGTPSPGVALDVQRSSADVQIRASTGTVDLRFWAYHAGAGVVGTNSAHPLLFSTNGLVERMRIDSSGNVGIGTSSPAYQAQVNGSGQTTAALTDAGNKGGSILIVDNGSAAGNGGALLFAASVTNGFLPGCAIKSLLINGASNGVSDLAFSTRNATTDTTLTERMRIDSGGNVGIGRTPAYKFDVNAVVSRIGDTGVNSYLQLGANATDLNNYLIGCETGSFAFYQGKYGGTATERMRIDSSGNVGIGTTPSYLLDIKKTTGDAVFRSLAGTVDFRSYASQTFNVGYTGTFSNNDFIVMQNSLERMRIASTGINVGGSNPTDANFAVFSTGTTYVPLRVQHTASTTNDAPIAMQLARLSSGTPAAGMGCTLQFVLQDAGAALIGTHQIVSAWSNAAVANRETSLRINYSKANVNYEALRIDTDGNVLIGYTVSNGAYKLQVNSQIFATNATIATSDRRYKKDITPIKSGLDVVSKLNPVSFTWKEHDIHQFDNGTQVGFIAQDVQAALTDEPYLESVVKRNEVELKDGTKEEFYGLSDAKLIPILVKAIQELKAKIDTLEARN